MARLRPPATGRTLLRHPTRLRLDRLGSLELEFVGPVLKRALGPLHIRDGLHRLVLEALPGMRRRHQRRHRLLPLLSLCKFAENTAGSKLLTSTGTRGKALPMSMRRVNDMVPSKTPGGPLLGLHLVLDVHNRPGFQDGCLPLEERIDPYSGRTFLGHTGSLKELFLLPF